MTWLKKMVSLNWFQERELCFAPMSLGLCKALFDNTGKNNHILTRKAKSFAEVAHECRGIVPHLLGWPWWGRACTYVLGQHLWKLVHAWTRVIQRWGFTPILLSILKYWTNGNKWPRCLCVYRKFSAEMSKNSLASWLETARGKVWADTCV